jgi:hypothetical protein
MPTFKTAEGGFFILIPIFQITKLKENRHCDKRSEEAIHKQGRAWITDKFLQETPLLWIAASGKALLAMTASLFVLL